MLDKFQKFSDIIFKGVISAAVAIITVYLTWQRDTGERIKQCDTFFTALIDTAVKQEATDAAKQSLLFRINSYGRMCGNLSDQQTQNIMNVMIPQKVISSTPSALSQGWVALSRLPAAAYADTNFDTTSSGKEFKTGDVIKARWSVNIREKNTPIIAGDNPVIGVVEAGTCVKISELQNGRLNAWARISPADCS